MDANDSADAVYQRSESGSEAGDNTTQLTKEKHRDNCRLPNFSHLRSVSQVEGLRRRLKEKHIRTVKQSSSWMGFFSKPRLPQAARFSQPASPATSHK